VLTQTEAVLLLTPSHPNSEEVGGPEEAGRGHGPDS